MQSHYNFEVKPTVSNGKVVSWELCFVGPPTSHNKLGCGEDADVYVPMNESNRSFKYTITGDPPGLGLAFAPKPPPSTNDGPIWIAFNNKPKSPFVDGEITGVSPGGGKILTFVDKNDTAGILEYQLNFVDKAGNKSVLDPDITNGGKGFFGADPTTLLIWAAVTAALVAALVAAFVARFVARREIRRGR